MRHTSRIVPQSHLRSAAALLPEHGADISRRYFLNIELSRPQDPERALGGLASRRENDGPPISVDPADTASPSSRVDMLSVRPPTSEAITATASKLVQQSVQQDASAPPLMETPAQQESTLSQAGNEAPGRLVAPTTSPDPVPAGAAVEAQHATAIPTNTAADFGLRCCRESCRRRQADQRRRDLYGTILAVLALGLGVLCVVAKNVAARHARTIFNHCEPDPTDDQRQHDRRGDQDQRRSVDERQLIVSALSDCSPVRTTTFTFQTTFEIGKRKDKLARLHQNLDRLLRSPTVA